MADSQQSHRAIALLHRRPAYAVNAPALLRHVCFRAEDSIEAASVTMAALKRAILIADLNLVLLSIQSRCGATALSSFRMPVVPSSVNESREVETERASLAAKMLAAEKLRPPEGGHERLVDRTQTMLIRLPAPGAALAQWRARICIDLHGEYYSLTYILDQLDPQSAGHKKGEHHAGSPKPKARHDGEPDFSATLFRAVAQEMSQAAEHQDTAARPARHHTDYSHYLDWWYRDIWARFDADALPAAYPFPGIPFAEFYGIAMQTERHPDAGTESSGHDPIIWPGASDEATRRKDLYSFVNANRDFLRGILQLAPGDDGSDKDANCVLCTMLWGSAIYGSSLGRPPSPGTDPGEETAPRAPPPRPVPLQYFVVSHGWSKYLLGRILRRLNALGELRSAAVLDLSLLDRASERMRALRNEIDEQLHTRDPNRDSATLEHGHLHRVQGTLNEIADSEINGGLLARVGRSRAYAADFKQRMEDMGFGRIDGWEPYDVFMHRNLFKTLEYIDAIGSRFEGLAATMQRLTAARNLHEVAEVERDIAHIQRIGEIIGWTAFAYYGGQLLATMLRHYALHYCEGAEHAAAICAWAGSEHDAEFAGKAIMVALAVILALIFVLRRMHAIRRTTHAIKRLWPRRKTPP